VFKCSGQTESFIGWP